MYSRYGTIALSHTQFSDHTGALSCVQALMLSFAQHSHAVYTAHVCVCVCIRLKMLRAKSNAYKGQIQPWKHKSGRKQPANKNWPLFFFSCRVTVVVIAPESNTRSCTKLAKLLQQHPVLVRPRKAGSPC